MDSAQARTLGELAELVGGTVRGDAGRKLVGVGSLSEAGPDRLAFFNNQRYRGQLKATRAGAVVVAEDALELLDGRDALVAADPYLAFAKASAAFHPQPSFKPGVDPRAVVEEGAQVDPTACVMAFAYVGSGARIGPRAVLFPQVFVGQGSVVGAEALLYPGVILREHTVVGARCILQPGAVLGGDGFGFAFDPSGPRHFKIPQVGNVVVEDEVEIGANSAIDRATSGSTRIGRGSKLDNLVQVGHNVQTGQLCILCGQAGLAGSSTLGNGVVLGGQVGVGNHAKLCDGTRVAAQSGVMADVDAPGEYGGSPITDSRDWMRSVAAFQKGAETAKLVRRLEKRLAELEARLAAVEGK